MNIQEQTIQADGHSINTLVLGEIDANKPTLVFIHGGLDCIGMWRQFPEQLCEATSLSAIVYERWGHGSSDKLVLPRGGDSRVMEAGQPLKDIFTYFGVGKVTLVGHSLGGAIALIASSIHKEKICGTVVIAPQLATHGDLTEGVARAVAAFEDGKLKDKLMAFHGDNTDILFRDWSSLYSHPDNVQPDYSPQLRKISCPVLGIYGTADNYGYLHNLELIEKCLDCPLENLEITNSGHYPHLDTSELVLEAAGRFIGKLIY